MSKTHQAQALQKRGPGGLYAPGNAGGPGRLPMVTETKYLKAMINVVDEEEWVEITQVAVEQAKNGNWRAREWLSHYLIGKPAQITHVEDKRSVHFDLSQLSDEQLGILTRIAQGVIAGGGEGETEPG